MLSTVGRVAAYIGLFVLGCAVAALGAFAQAAYLPGGLIAALAGAGGAFVVGGYAMQSKGGALAPAAGWLVTAFYIAANPRPEGDWVFTSGATSYLFLFGGSIIGVAIAMQPWGGTPGFLLLSGERTPHKNT